MDPKRNPVPAALVWEKRDLPGKGGRKQMLSWACLVAAEKNGECSMDYWIRKKGIFFHSFYSPSSSK